MGETPTRDVKGAYDLGAGNYLRTMEPDLIWSHEGCRSWHLVDVSTGTKHRVSAGSIHDLEHLTIEGSLLCPVGQGAHGFVRDGKWVGA